jgi:hypothetical protein
MHDNHRARVPSGEMSTVEPGRSGPMFMFGTFDPADTTSSASLDTLGQAILGIMEDGDPAAVTTWKHRHAEVAADASSSAFMFGVHAEQPPPATLGELPLYLGASALD